MWREIGGFDEELQTNEDYDFNYRVRLNGKTVLLDRSEHCEYFARPTLKDLFFQYSRYGTWKARMIRRHPRSVKWRHAVAPAFVASLPILLISGFWLRPAWWILLLELGIYVLLAVAFAARLARQYGEGARLIVTLPLVFLTIHLSWGSTLLLGLLGPRQRMERLCT